MSSKKNHPSVFGKQRTERRQRAASFHRRKLRHEPLEDRRMLAVIMVNTNSDTTNLNDNLTTLREAIFAANVVPGADEIKFAPSVVEGTSHTILLKEGEIKITDSLTITGLGADKLTINASGNDTTPELKDGKGSRIFNITGPKEGEKLNVSISRLKLTGGDTTLAGGAISSTSTNLTITGSTITGNAAAFAGGGGLYHSNGNLSIIESSISGNAAGTINGANGAPGGGIFINNTAFTTAGPTVQIRGSEIANNTATGDGGGIAVQGFGSTAVTITESQILGNKSTVLGSGGGMIMTAGPRTFPTLTIEHVTFGNNSASANATGGGGLTIYGVNATIASSEFTANAGGRNGGAIFAGERSRLKLSNSTISNNTAAFTGGGIAGNVTSVFQSETNGFSFTGNTFAGNSVTSMTGDNRGGGLFLVVAASGTTTISGNTFRENMSASGGGAALQLNSTSAQLVIDESHFNSNRANGPNIAAGGGLHLTGSSSGVTIRNASFENNLAQSTQVTALGQGGGLFSMLPKLTIEGSRFAANKAGLQGGGIALSGGATITGTEIVGNAAQGTKGLGGGIYLSGSTANNALLVTDSTISGNTATLNGGGVYLSSGGPGAQFERVKFNENSATQDGGAISAIAREVVLRSSTLSHNTAGRDGGGLSTSRSGKFVVNSSTVNNNTAGRNGGGASIVLGSLNAVNSTFSANRSTNNGGGLYSDSGATLAHSTLFQNRADQIGGGVFLTAGIGNIRNTVIAGNTAPLGRDLSGLLGVTLNLHYSLIGSNLNSGLTPAPVGAPDANGNIIGSTSPIDPRLGTLANNGGPTATHMPLNESPLKNHGDPSAVAGQQDVPQFDQRGTGFPRVAFGRLDIGAVEVQPIIITGDFNADGTVDARDFVLARKLKAAESEWAAWRYNFGAGSEQNVAAQTAATSDSAPTATSTRFAVSRRPQFATGQAGELAAADEASLLSWVAENSRSRPVARPVEWFFDPGSDLIAAGNCNSEAFDEAFAGLIAE
jgi:predicted outer membrane repeat protein